MKIIKRRSTKHISQEQEEERDFDKERRERQFWRPHFPDILDNFP